jgi:hypothetical protein
MPKYLAAGIILAILVFSLLVVPEYKKLLESEKKYNYNKSIMLEQKEKLDALKTLPSFDVVLDTKDDTVLAIKKVFEQQKYQVTNIADGSDKIGKYVSFSVLANNYSSIAGVISYLNAVSQALPMKYTGYEIINKNIKVNALCYVTHQ